MRKIYPGTLKRYTENSFSLTLVFVVNGSSSYSVIVGGVSVIQLNWIDDLLNSQEFRDYGDSNLLVQLIDIFNPDRTVFNNHTNSKGKYLFKYMRKWMGDYTFCEIFLMPSAMKRITYEKIDESSIFNEHLLNNVSIRWLTTP